MRAISSMATRRVLADLGSAAAEAGLPSVEIESVGGVDAAQRVASGEEWDLVFLASDALAKLAATGDVDAATIVPLLLSQVAIAVRSEGAEPAARPAGAAFENAAGVRDALIAAPLIGYSTGPSGTALREMISRWGLEDQLASRLVQARPGIPVAASLAAGEVSLGFQQLSELVGQPGIRILGVMPSDCAIDTVFAGAVATTATDPHEAQSVLDYFASGSTVSIKAAHNFGVAPR